MVKLSEISTPNKQVWAEMEANDPEFRAEWQRLALARAVADALGTYRKEHGLTMKGLAERIGTRPPQIARLESGDYEPELRTLRILAEKLGMSFMVTVQPDGAAAFSPTGPDSTTVYDRVGAAGGVSVTVAAGRPVRPHAEVPTPSARGRKRPPRAVLAS